MEAAKTKAVTHGSVGEALGVEKHKRHRRA